jgi:hypothetical protein
MTPSRRRHRQFALLAIGALAITALGLVEHSTSPARVLRPPNLDLLVTADTTTSATNEVMPS